MHVSGLAVFDPSTRADGRLSFRDVEGVIASRIHLAPKLRRRVLEVPGHVALPVWADDRNFDLGFHLRHAALPAPGGRAELTDFVQRVLSRPLDRSKPLWELYVIEGLEHEHVATIMKVHHAVIDGISGMQIAMGFYDLTPEPPADRMPPPWTPEEEPTTAELLRAGIEHQLTHPASALADAARSLVRAPGGAALDVSIVASGVRSMLGMGARPRSPFDTTIGPNRRFAITDAPLQMYKDVKNALGGTVNDVVLTVVAGGIHRLLRDRRVPTKGVTLRVMVPVSVRTENERGGNRVAPAFVDVPVGAMSPKRRLAIVRESTATLKESMMAMSADAIIGLGAYAPGGMLAAAARAASRGPWFNLVVSNIPGPQVPLYLAGARLVANYPSMPLGRNSALSIACTSLGGTMAFGLTADWDALPDVDALAIAMEDSLAELAKSAGL